MNRLSAAIAFILTTECGVIKKGEISLKVLKEESVVVGRVNREKRVTDSERGNRRSERDQNINYILIS